MSAFSCCVGCIFFHLTNWSLFLLVFHSSEARDAQWVFYHVRLRSRSGQEITELFSALALFQEKKKCEEEGKTGQEGKNKQAGRETDAMATLSLTTFIIIIEFTYTHTHTYTPLPGLAKMSSLCYENVCFDTPCVPCTRTWVVSWKPSLVREDSDRKYASRKEQRADECPVHD